jgi:hypothetical protein
MRNAHAEHLIDHFDGREQRIGAHGSYLFTQPPVSQRRMRRNTTAQAMAHTRAISRFSLRVNPARSEIPDFSVFAILPPPELLVQNPALHEAYCTGSMNMAEKQSI